MPGVTNNVLVEDDGWVRTLSSRTVVSCGNVFVYELETVDAIVLMTFQMRGEKIARHLLVSHRLAGPPKLRLEAGGKICPILAQNDGTFVTFLRDKSVTKLDAWARPESHQCVSIKGA